MLRRPTLALAAAVLLPVAALANSCVHECRLECLWADYLAHAKEAAEDMERAAHYDGTAADGYQQALDAAQAELESFVPSIEGIVQGEILGEVCDGVLAQMQRVERVMQAVMGIQGGLVLERMAQVARRNAAWNWRIAKGRLTRYRWCCKNKPPEAPEDIAPPPTPPQPPTRPPAKTGGGGSGERPPLGHGKLDDIRLARQRAKGSEAPPRKELALQRPGGEVFWNVVATGKSPAATRAAKTELRALCQHPDEMVRYEALRALKTHAPDASETREALQLLRTDPSRSIQDMAR